MLYSFCSPGSSRSETTITSRQQYDDTHPDNCTEGGDTNPEHGGGMEGQHDGPESLSEEAKVLLAECEALEQGGLCDDAGVGAGSDEGLEDQQWCDFPPQ